MPRHVTIAVLTLDNVHASKALQDWKLQSEIRSFFYRRSICSHTVFSNYPMMGKVTYYMYIFSIGMVHITSSATYICLLLIKP